MTHEKADRPVLASLTALGTIAVLAVVLVVVYVAGTRSPSSTTHGTATTDASSSPATASSSTASGATSRTPTTDIPVPLKTVTVDPKKLPTGPGPAIAYYQQAGALRVCGDSGWGAATGYVYPPTGHRVPIALGPDESLWYLARLGTGYLVAVQRCSHGFQIRRYAADGTRTDLTGFLPVPSAGAVATGSDGSVAVSLAKGHITLFDAQGKQQQTWTLRSSPTYIAPGLVLPDGSVLAENSLGHLRWHLRPDGTITSPTKADLKTFAAAGGPLFTGATCGRPTIPGVTATDPQTYQVMWIACGYSAASVSPDGRLAVALAQGQGGILGLLDATTGDVLVRFAATSPRWNSAHVTGMHWEDSTHLLVFEGRYYNKPQVVLRFGVDGTVEEVPLAKPVTDPIPVVWSL